MPIPIDITAALRAGGVAINASDRVYQMHSGRVVKVRTMHDVGASETVSVLRMTPSLCDEHGAAQEHPAGGRPDVGAERPMTIHAYAETDHGADVERTRFACAIEFDRAVSTRAVLRALTGVGEVS